jgi:hypothetical protein
LKKLTTLNLNGNQYEIVDKLAREEIKNIEAAHGENGITPHIGDNGNWFIGDEDTGLPSRGEQGTPGINGENGKDGTSIYITSINESTMDGGENKVTFSDGKILTVKNGSKGDKGDSSEVDLTGYATTEYVDNIVDSINSSLDELHAYAQGIISGGVTE